MSVIVKKVVFLLISLKYLFLFLYCIFHDKFRNNKKES